MNAIMRRNLFASPSLDPSWLTISREDPTVVASAADGVLTITGAGTDATYCEIETVMTPGETMRFTIHVEHVGSWPAYGNAVWIHDRQWNGLTADTSYVQGDSTLTFTVPDDGRAIIRLRGLGDGARFARPQIEPAATYDAGIAGGGLRFFSGDLMPLG